MSADGRFEVNGWLFSRARFNATDLFRIADIPGPIQRLWRSRRQLAHVAGSPSSFDSRDVAEIMVRYDLSRLGVAPSETEKVARVAAQIILWFALLNSDGTCEVFGSPEDTSAFLTRFERDEGIANALTGEADVHRFLCRRRHGDFEFVADIAAHINTCESRALTYVDLERAAYDLAERAARPLFTVNIAETSDGKRTRRLTGQRAPELRLVTTKGAPSR